MTFDDATLSRALHELAGTAPDNPGRLSQVHLLARRRHRRQRAVGAGALAVTIAAGVAGAEALSSSGSRLSPGIRPAVGGAVTPPAGATGATLPACPASPPKPATNKADPLPSAGQEFTGGALVSAPGAATAVDVTVQGGPLKGSDLTLTIGPDSKVYLNDQPVTGAQLLKGMVVKFAATKLSADSYLIDELHAGMPSATGTPSAGAAAKQGAGAAVTPPAVGQTFKIVGSVTAVTATTVSVDVQGGSLPPGPVTFRLTCSPAGPLLGRIVGVAGMRTHDGYDATAVAVEGP